MVVFWAPSIAGSFDSGGIVSRARSEPGRSGTERFGRGFFPDAHAAIFLVAELHEAVDPGRLIDQAHEIGELAGERFARGGDGGLRGFVGGNGFGHDFVDDAEAVEVGGGDAHGFRGVGRFGVSFQRMAAQASGEATA